MCENSKENPTDENVDPIRSTIKFPTRIDRIMELTNTNSIASTIAIVKPTSTLKDVNYLVSPIHSDESDFDDSEADPNFDSSSSSTSDSDEEIMVAETEEPIKKGKKRQSKPSDWKTKKINY